MRQNYLTFRDFLRSAISNRTQAQFANDSGISAEHLSRMLNADVIHRPTKSTLHKIAAAAKNGITFQDLYNALNGDDGTDGEQWEFPASTPSESKSCFSDIAGAIMSEISEKTKSASYPIIVDSLADYMTDLLSSIHVPDGCSVVYDFSRDRKYYGKRFPFASSYVCAYISMADRHDTAMSELLVYFTEISCINDKVQYIVQYASCAVEDIFELYGMPPAAMGAVSVMSATDGDAAEGDIDKAIALPYYLDFAPVERFRETSSDDGRSAGDKLLQAIFREPTLRPMTYEGVGFYLQQVPESLARFVYDHRSTILDKYCTLDNRDENMVILKEAIDRCYAEDDSPGIAQVLGELDYQDDSYCNDSGWQAAVAVVMAVETSFPFRYRAAVEDSSACEYMSKEGCIMVTEDDACEEHIQREAMLLATCKYANALGIARFGDILFTNMCSYMDKLRTYTAKQNYDGDDFFDTKPVDCSVEFVENGERPVETGVYMVELKDGRRMRMFYLHPQGHWILRHREWSDMISRYCPDVLRIPKKKGNE